jgi:hypothetical protein
LLLTQELPLPEDDAEREVRWCEDEHILGISRQQTGGIELFLCGEELRASSPLIQRHMKFDHWTRAGGEVFRANRLVLPSDDHFVPVAAFLAEELLRRNVTNSLAASFAQTEPLIEMALKRVALSEEEILGLLGELRFLEVLLSVAVNSRQRAIALDAWRGNERGARDFVFGIHSVEVKSTRGDRSLHRIGSVMQVDPRRSESNEPQEELFLLSLGFKPDSSNIHLSLGLSLPTQVDAILQKLASPNNQANNSGELQTLFLAKVASYGATGRGYEHEEMRNWSAYQTRWQHGFLRIYDMNDSAIQVLRRSDVQRRGHVVLDSVSFQIDLPERVSGDLNPQTDLFALARRLLD